MIIKDEKMLAQFRGPGSCKLCGCWCRDTEGHHLSSRGAGRLDIRINLIQLGSSRKMCCGCHTRIHNGDITRETLDGIVAVREGTTAEAIQVAVWVIRGLPKRIKNNDVATAIASRNVKHIAKEVKRLVVDALAEFVAHGGDIY